MSACSGRRTRSVHVDQTLGGFMEITLYVSINTFYRSVAVAGNTHFVLIFSAAV